MASGLTKAVGGRRWDNKSSTPYYYYLDTNGTFHRRDYDDTESLILKYEFAKSSGACGAGMWTADSVDYTNRTQVEEFWDALLHF